MSNPQQPELARSRKTPAQDPDAAAGVLEGQQDVGADAPRGPVPPENQPGHHPEKEQDKPDVNAFAERLGTVEPSEREGRSDSPIPSVPPEKRNVVVGVGAAVATLLAVILAVIAGRKRRSRRSH